MQTPTEQLSSAFTKIISQWLTRDEIEQINTLNENTDYEGYCASHRFCDPNAALLQAFKETFGREADFSSMEDTNMMNKAHGISKAMKFLN